MFTEAERLPAIELYFKYGRKLAPVVRELGYPSKRNLQRDRLLQLRNPVAITGTTGVEDNNRALPQ